VTTEGHAHTVREEFAGIAAFIGAIWLVFLLECVIGRTRLMAFGLAPRSLLGTTGIVTMPFLHANLGHLISNTIPLFILLALLAGSQARSWEIVGEIVLLGGALLWAFGRAVVHVGASGLVFGLVSFLIAAGFLEKRLIPFIVSIVVGFLYGTTLLWNVLPTVGPHVSWDGHLCGAVAGVLCAYGLARNIKRPEPGVSTKAE